MFGRVSDAWSRQDDDSRGTLLLIAGLGALVVFALVVIGYGYYVDRIAPNSDAVLKVGDRTFSYEELERRVLTDAVPSPALTQAAFTEIVTNNLADLERQELMLLIGKENGIGLTETEIENQLRDDLNVSENADRETYAHSLRAYLLDKDKSLSGFRREAKVKLIESKYREQVSATLPTEADQVNVRLLRTASQADAATAKQRLDAGEELAGVAAVLSNHPSKSKAGEVGWVIRGTFASRLEDALFALQPGQKTDIVETDEGFFIAEVRAREVRPVEVETKTAAVSHAISESINDMREKAGSQILLTNGQLARLMRSVQNVSVPGG
jgi:parvulin-like peptidyl-prolyl isomerase